MEPLNKIVVMVATESHPIFNIEVGQSIIIGPFLKRGSRDPWTAELVRFLKRGSTDGRIGTNFLNSPIQSIYLMTHSGSIYKLSEKSDSQKMFFGMSINGTFPFKNML